MPPKLGIVAGGGQLPSRLAAACDASARPHHVVALEGECECDWLANHPHDWTSLGAVGRTIDLLRKAGCREVVLAGRLSPPQPAQLKTDGRGAKVLAKIAMRGFGADAALKVLVAELESEGFRVVGADEVLTDLLAPTGVLGRHHPRELDQLDIDVASRAARAIGRLDIGQAAIACDGRILALEAVEGTDAMIARAGALRGNARGGVLVKLCKPGQERRVDLPAVGPDTVAAAVSAGLAGIAIEAGGALLIDRIETVARADEAGIFMLGIDVHEAD